MKVTPTNNFTFLQENSRKKTQERNFTKKLKQETQERNFSTNLKNQELFSSTMTDFATVAPQDFVDRVKTLLANEKKELQELDKEVEKFQKETEAPAKQRWFQAVLKVGVELSKLRKKIAEVKPKYWKQWWEDNKQQADEKFGFKTYEEANCYCQVTKKKKTAEKLFKDRFHLLETNLQTLKKTLNKFKDETPSDEELVEFQKPRKRSRKRKRDEADEEDSELNQPANKRPRLQANQVPENSVQDNQPDLKILQEKVKNLEDKDKERAEQLEQLQQENKRVQEENQRLKDLLAAYKKACQAQGVVEPLALEN